jgi:hypothetical protein
LGSSSRCAKACILYVFGLWRNAEDDFKDEQDGSVYLILSPKDYLSASGIVGCYHERGSDELANRALKDFWHEQLPFKKFNPNAAWYYSMLLGHFLMESFKIRNFFKGVSG